MLPCEHTMCTECLVQLIRSSRRFNSFSCPVDRKEFTAPSYTISADDWAQSFPVDDLTITLLQTVTGKEVHQSTKRKGTPCSQHPEIFCEFFCFNCVEIMCSECAVNRHKGKECDCVVFSKCNDRVDMKLEHLSNEMQSLIDIGENIISRESKKEMRLIQCKGNIRDTVTKLVRIIQDFERVAYIKLSEILERLNKVANNAEVKQTISSINNDLRIKREEVHGIIATVSTENKLLTLSEFQKYLQQYTDQLFSLAESKDPVKLKLELNQDFLTLCNSLNEFSVGKLHTVPDDSVDFEDTETQVGNYRLKFTTNTSETHAEVYPLFISIKGELNSNGTSPRYTDMIFSGHSLIVVDSHNCMIQRFQFTDENSFIDETFINGCFGIAHVHESDDVVVTAPIGKSRLLRLSTYKGLSIVSESVTEAPYYEITQLPCERYAAIRHEIPPYNSNKTAKFIWARGTTSHIDIIDQRGNVFQHFNESLLCEPGEFGQPFIMPLKCLCGLPNGNLVVTAETKSSNFITCVNESGRILWTYNMSDKPEGVCCSDDSIHVYLRESKVLRAISFDGDLKPMSTYRLAEYEGDGANITYNKSRKLIGVVDKTDIIRTYKLL